MKKVSSTILKLIILSTLVVGFSGCMNTGLKLVPNQKYISNYKNDNALDNKKSVVYIINNFTNLLVECNDKRYLVDKNEYLPCTINRPINTIAIAYINPGVYGSKLLETENAYPTTYLAVDNVSDKELFYLYNFESSGPSMPIMSFKKIDPQVGMSIVGNPEYKITKSFNKPTAATGHEIGLLNPSLFYYMTKQDLETNKLQQDLNNKIDTTFQVLKKEEEKKKEEKKKDLLKTYDDDFKTTDTELREEASKTVIGEMSQDELLKLYFSKTLMKLDKNPITTKDGESAKIIIYREKDNGNSLVGLWTEDEYVGSLMVQSYLKFETTKNELNLYTKYGTWKKLNIKLEKGKTYYIEADSEIGWEDVYTSLNIKTKEDFDTHENMNKVSIDNDKINENYQLRIKQALKLIKQNR